VAPSEPLRVAVVGPGGWGAQHTRIFSGRDDTDLVAVVGRDPDRTRAAAGALGTRGFVDVEAMLGAVQPDLVTVALPNEDHFETTERLLRTGVAVLVEKPLVFDLDEADRLLTTAADSGSPFAVHFNHRYAEPLLRARAAIGAGDLGDLVFATWRFGGEANHGAHPHKNIVETQCHGFDQLEDLVGPIASVTAQMTARTYGAFSTVALALEFENGAVGTLLGSYDSSYAYPDTHRLEVNGTRGRLVVEDTVRRLTVSRAGEATSAVWEAGYFDDEARSFHATADRYVEALLTALRAGQPPPVPASAGRRALLLALAAIRSFETGRRVLTPSTETSFRVQEEPT
jgi:predicted dehydrogenase